MHPNPIYHTGSRDDCLEFARHTGFGMLAVSASDCAPHVAHVPYVLIGDRLELHLMRSNPVAGAARDGIMARMSVQGAHGYVSPDWYGMADQVPTWNYVAVQMTGQLEPMETEALRGVLDRISAEYEARLAPKPQWLVDKMPEEALARLMRIIQPFVLHIQDVDGTWKLGQNKPEAARWLAADGM